MNYTAHDTLLNDTEIYTMKNYYWIMLEENLHQEGKEMVWQVGHLSSSQTRLDALFNPQNFI